MKMGKQKQSKVPQSPWLFYYPHPPRKKEHQGAVEDEGSRRGARSGLHRPCVRFKARVAKAPQARKRDNLGETGGKVNKGLNAWGRAGGPCTLLLAPASIRKGREEGKEFQLH